MALWRAKSKSPVELVVVNLGYWELNGVMQMIFGIWYLSARLHMEMFSLDLILRAGLY